MARLRSGASPRHNLPPERTSFVGRAAEIERVAGLIDEGAQLVTVVGAPGVGKTRLAHRVACRFVDDPAGQAGAWFCDLTEARRGDDVLGAVAGVLGVPMATGSGGDDVADQLGRAIAGRGDALLVLDNFEQVLESAPIVARWMVLAPRATFLVTSRARLRLEGESVLELASLPCPLPEVASAEAVLATDAVALWVARVQAVSPGYRPSEADAVTLAAISRHLDGLPLAIELCAARSRVLGPAQLLARLRNRFDVLVGAPDAPARHATLRNAIDWSWNLLDADEQRALAQCSLFRGGFDPDAAEAVVDLGRGAPPVLRVLEGLLEKSLLRVGEPPEFPGERRYRLDESIREYAREKHGDVDAGAARHAAHFVAVGLEQARATHGPRSSEALARIALEADNLFAVHDWAMADASREGARLTHALNALAVLHPLYAARGGMLRYVELLAAAVATAASVEVPPAIEARALAHLAMSLTLTRSPHDLAVGHAERAMERAGAAADPAVAALANTFGAAVLAMNRSDAVIEAHFARARAALDVADAPHLEASFARYYGQHLARTGRAEEAPPIYDRALVAVRQAGCKQQEGHLLGSIGIRFMERGALDEAHAHLELSTRLLREVGDARTEGIYLGTMGMVEQERGRFAAARQHLEAALELERAVGAVYIEMWALVQLGNVAFEEGTHLEAVRRYREALTLTSEVGDARFTHAQLGGALARLGRVPDARAQLEEARRLLVGDDRFDEALALLEGQLDVAAARVAMDGGDADGAAARLAALAPLLAREPNATGPGAEDARLARRLLTKAIDDARRPPDAAGMADSARALSDLDALHVGRGGMWFRPPGGERVDLSRRGVLRRFLAVLTDLRLTAPDAALPLHDVVAAVWPGERMKPEAAAARVYTTVKYLRRMGMEALLVSREDGYLLDPVTPVRQLD